MNYLKFLILTSKTWLSHQPNENVLKNKFCSLCNYCKIKFLILSDQIFNLFDIIDLEAHVFAFTDLIWYVKYLLTIIVINKYSIPHKKPIRKKSYRIIFQIHNKYLRLAMIKNKKEILPWSITYFNRSK